MNTLQLQDRSTKQTKYEKLKTPTHMALNFEVEFLADRIYSSESKTHIVLRVPHTVYNVLIVFLKDDEFINIVDYNN